MSEPRPHWDDDLLASVMTHCNDIEQCHAAIAAVEDWQDANGLGRIGQLLGQRQSAINERIEAEAAIQRVRELHRPCSDPHLHDGGRCCLECSDYGRQGVVRMYPCDTLNALEGDNDDE